MYLRSNLFGNYPNSSWMMSRWIGKGLYVRIVKCSLLNVGRKSSYRDTGVDDGFTTIADMSDHDIAIDRC